jgi:hypothetical protein
VRPRPGYLIVFSGIIGEERGPCLVIAVHTVDGYKMPDIGVRVLFLTSRSRLVTYELIGEGESRPWREVSNDLQ